MSWYGSKYEGRRTSSGRRFHAKGLTAASRTLPFGTRLQLTNPKNKKTVIITITDRGPQNPAWGLDISEGAAIVLGIKQLGITKVAVETLPSEHTCSTYFCMKE